MGSNTPCHRTFSRDALAAYAVERRRELSDEKNPSPPSECWARKDELQRLYDHFELGKDRPRAKRVTLTRYDG